MMLVEPLEAANFARLQSVNARVASEGPYVLPGHAATKPPQSLIDATVICRPGVRPSRFRWLENQRTLQLTGNELWEVPYGINEYHVNKDAVQVLALREPGWSKGRFGPRL
jgi:hypothetical protein